MKDNIFLIGISEKYPKELLDKRAYHEGNVLACLMKNLSLMDDLSIDRKYFISQDGLFLYGLINNIRKKGFTVFDEVTILTNTSDDVIKTYEEIGGFEMMENMMESVNLDNFENYVDIVYRENLLCKLYDDGFNVLKEIKDSKGKPIVLLDMFRKMTSIEVEEWYESRLASYPIGNAGGVLEDSDLVLDDEFLSSIEEGEEMGTPFDDCGTDINGEKINGYGFLSNRMLGFLHSTLSMIGGFSSVGKSTFIIGLIMALINNGEKVVVVSNEEKIARYKLKIWMWCLAKYCRYYKLPRSKFQKGDINEEDRRQLKLAQEWFHKNFESKLRIVSIVEADMSLCKKQIKDKILKWGATAFIYDTFKLQESDMNSDRTDLSLVRDSRELDRLARKYNVIGIANVQLTMSMKNKLWLDASVISNSKQVIEILENLLLMRNVFKEELDPKNKKLNIRPYKLKKTDSGWIEEEYQVDPMKSYKALFLDKLRSGQSSNDSGSVLIYEFDGAHCVFREACWGKPKTL